MYSILLFLIIYYCIAINPSQELDGGRHCRDANVGTPGFTMALQKRHGDYVQDLYSLFSLEFGFIWAHICYLQALAKRAHHISELLNRGQWRLSCGGCCNIFQTGFPEQEREELSDRVGFSLGYRLQQLSMSETLTVLVWLLDRRSGLLV